MLRCRLFYLLFFTFAASAQATSFNSKAVLSPNFEAKFYSVEEWESFFEQSKKAREPAAANSQNLIFDESYYTPFKELSTRLLKILDKSTTPAIDLDQLLEDYEKKYLSLPTDAQFLVAILLPLKALRGFDLRAQSLTNRTGYKVNFEANAAVFLPNEKFRFYLRTPRSKFTRSFRTIKDAQTYLKEQLYPLLLKSVALIDELNFSDEVVVWDRTLPLDFLQFSPDYGGATGGNSRYVVLSNAAKYIVLSHFHEFMYRLNMGIAYDN